MMPAITLQAELMGDERALRHLITEEQALTSRVHRELALKKLADVKHTSHVVGPDHPAVSRSRGDGIAHGQRFYDVSSYQPGANLRVAKEARSLLMGHLGCTKLTEGDSYTDSYGLERWREMKTLDYPRRAGYHFIHPSMSPSEQAAHLLAVLHDTRIEVTEQDILVCDCEVSDGERSAVVATCVAEFGSILRRETKAQLWLYGGGPFLRANDVHLAPYDGHWLAAYTDDPEPYMVFGREHTVAWQFTDGVHGPTPHVCPGLGACDLDIIL
jgi:GH25 family lysozyme M1 (1,4-beta-N-acetylmuramidase)